MRRGGRVLLIWSGSSGVRRSLALRWAREEKGLLDGLVQCNLSIADSVLEGRNILASETSMRVEGLLPGFHVDGEKKCVSITHCQHLSM